MKISIVTVTYNSEKFLTDCINSVFSQSHRNIEYIVIDGKSSDKTGSVIASYGKKVHHFISEPDRGIYDAMNKGISLATGDIIGILNSDDLYVDSTVISDVVKQFINDPELDILYGDLVYIERESPDKIVRNWRSSPYYESFFEDANVPPHPTLFLRKKVYDTAGVFNLQYKLASDYEFMLRIFKKYNFKSKYIPRLMVRMRLGGATNKSIKNIINGNMEIIKAWQKNSLNFPLLFFPKKIYKRLAQFI